jgi:TonB family protein
MRSRIGISLFATAIAVSAVAHALVLVTFKSLRIGAANPAREFSEMAVVYEGPQAERARNDSEFEIGQPLGKGYATHDLEGQQEQRAREAPQDQPSLSLDPVGGSRLVEVPSAPGDASHGPAPITPGPPPALASDLVPPALPPLAPDAENGLRRERIEAMLPPSPTELPTPLPEGVEIAFAPAAEPTPPPLAPQPAQSVAAAPASPVDGSGADPAPQSESESDAVSVLGSAQFRAGRVTVQSGRQVKTRRPKIGLAGMVELSQRSVAQVELNVSVDRSGKVTNVEVARSSGSNNIDQPCRVAMYDWWFEPKKDAAGRPLPDRFLFTISFR